jgi:serine protease SohB
MTISEFFARYGLFLIELLTVFVLLAALGAIIVIASRRGTVSQPGLVVTKLNECFEQTRDAMRAAVLDKPTAKRLHKERKRARAAEKKSPQARRRIFVIDFKGDLRASATASLREEVSAVLAIADDGDAVFVRLENAGGTVHEHGLAASQLARVKSRGLSLTVAVDKVAASGGYLMACVADRIIAAPFAIVGSIGVLAQLPNFHRWLEARGVDFEQVTAGRFKRTLTVFGENTEEGRQKLRSELEDVHAMFKSQIAEHRPQVDVEAVATGEHWYGLRALELKLVDEVQTSDDYLMGRIDDTDLFLVEYKRRKPLPERVMGGVESLLSH